MFSYRLRWELRKERRLFSGGIRRQQTNLDCGFCGASTVAGWVEAHQAKCGCWHSWESITEGRAHTPCAKAPGRERMGGYSGDGQKVSVSGMWKVERSWDEPGGRDRGQTFEALWACKDMDLYPKSVWNLVDVLKSRGWLFLTLSLQSSEWILGGCQGECGLGGPSEESSAVHQGRSMQKWRMQVTFWG